MVEAQEERAVEQDGARRRHLGSLKKATGEDVSRNRQDAPSQMKMGVGGGGINRLAPVVPNPVIFGSRRRLRWTGPA